VLFGYFYLKNENVLQRKPNFCGTAILAGKRGVEILNLKVLKTNKIIENSKVPRLF